ncbi:DNA polymerase III subunit delta' [Vulgatibacter incomptus]|uniref:DNA polymerase III delta prime subunit n=1 Tax=Vulgatibacter incomptus TaxID=1391653 RepID=A0A0K1PAA2_9BACT|nr:DNA polymerase III subunit delta' [Vulgatibacter incomptus]AKU90445.1 DNA polymerase III delta prime subunit [Vulgatibacter incomptus]
MNLSSIFGQPRATSMLRSALERRRIHHAWLFAGPEGVGKEAAARAFAASLLCRAGGGEPVVEACGTCPSCQKLDRGVHPDLVEILPEAEAVARKRIAREDLPKAPSRELKIDQIRKLQASLSLAPLEGPRRVVVMIGADTLNAPAQNAFLKTLEEPPTGTHIVLLADTADALLPTTRSRCVRVPFAPLPLELVAERVAEQTGDGLERARLRAALAGGSLGAALRIDGPALESRGRILEAIEALDPADLRPLLRLAEELGGKGREESELALDVVALFYRDAALGAEGVSDDALANQDQAALVRAAAARGAEDALRRHRLALRAKAAIGRHAMGRLAFERMLLGFVMPEEA